MNSITIPDSVRRICSFAFGAQTVGNTQNSKYYVINSFTVRGTKNSFAKRFCDSINPNDAYVSETYIRPTYVEICENHTLVPVSQKNATYTEYGHNSYSICSACGEKIGYEVSEKAVLSTPLNINIVAKTKAIKVSFKKVSYASGYEVQYSTSKSFKSAKKIVINNSSKNSTTIKKLIGNKKYYVRVRAYKTENSKSAYSLWSKTMSVKTKK